MCTTILWHGISISIWISWPGEAPFGLYFYNKQICNACPGWPLANPIKSKSPELVYNFPIKAPFLVLFINAYSEGRHSSIDGSKAYLIACCGMSGFASMEPIQHTNSKNFAHENSIVLWILPHSCSGQGRQLLWCLPHSPWPPAHQLSCSIRQHPQSNNCQAC